MYFIANQISMTTDRLFVIMLVILIPMTGCFGGVGESDAQNPDDNSVPADNSDTSIDIISVGGQTNESTTISGTYLEPYAFTTDPGQFVEIMYFNVAADNNNGPFRIETLCNGISHYTYQYQTTDYNVVTPIYLFGSHTQCTHTISLKIDAGDNNTSYPAYSLVYKVHDTYALTMNF